MLLLLLACGSDAERVRPILDPEVCNGLDDDRDGRVDAADASIVGAVWRYPDTDADGYGAGRAARVCPDRPGYADVDGDCDDGDSTRYPGAPELCDGRDDDCDDLVDVADPDLDPDSATVRYRDRDLDGWGDDGAMFLACDDENPGVAESGDCDDADPAVHPEAVEHCNGADDDCDPLTADSCAVWMELDDLVTGRVLAEPENVAGWEAPAALVGDLDGDDVPEVAFATRSRALDGMIGQLNLVHAPRGDQALVSSAVAIRYGHGLDGLGLVGGSDLDGDGVVDLAMASTTVCRDTWCPVETEIYRGPLVGEIGDPALTVSGGADRMLTGGPDLDGDGGGDLVLAVDDAELWLVHGDREGRIGTPDGRLTVGEGDGGLLAVATADVDGDGATDLLVGSRGAAQGEVALLLGPIGSGSLANADQVIRGTAARTFGVTVTGAGDVDGDGRDDVLATTRDEGAHLFVGLPDGATVREDAWLHLAPFKWTPWAAAGPAGDIDGDGDGEVWLSNPEMNDFRSGGLGYAPGGAGGWMDPEDLWVLAAGEAHRDRLGTGIAQPADLDGDSVPDLFVTGRGIDPLAWVVSGASVFAGRGGVTEIP